MQTPKKEPEKKYDALAELNITIENDEHRISELNAKITHSEREIQKLSDELLAAPTKRVSCEKVRDKLSLDIQKLRDNNARSVNQDAELTRYKSELRNYREELKKLDERCEEVRNKLLPKERKDRDHLLEVRERALTSHKKHLADQDALKVSETGNGTNQLRSDKHNQDEQPTQKRPNSILQQLNTALGLDDTQCGNYDKKNYAAMQSVLANTSLKPPNPSAPQKVTPLTPINLQQVSSNGSFNGSLPSVAGRSSRKGSFSRQNILSWKTEITFADFIYLASQPTPTETGARYQIVKVTGSTAYEDMSGRCFHGFHTAIMTKKEDRDIDFPRNIIRNGVFVLDVSGVSIAIDPNIPKGEIDTMTEKLNTKILDVLSALLSGVKLALNETQIDLLKKAADYPTWCDSGRIITTTKAKNLLDFQRAEDVRKTEELSKKQATDRDKCFNDEIFQRTQLVALQENIAQELQTKAIEQRVLRVLQEPQAADQLQLVNEEILQRTQLLASMKTEHADVEQKTQEQEASVEKFYDYFDDGSYTDAETLYFNELSAFNKIAFAKKISAQFTSLTTEYVISKAKLDTAAKCNETCKQLSGISKEFASALGIADKLKELREGLTSEAARLTEVACAEKIASEHAVVSLAKEIENPPIQETALKTTYAEAAPIIKPAEAATTQPVVPEAGSIDPKTPREQSTVGSGIPTPPRDPRAVGLRTPPGQSSAQDNRQPATEVKKISESDVSHQVEKAPLPQPNFDEPPADFKIDTRNFSARVFDQLFGRKQKEKINIAVTITSKDGSKEISLGEKKLLLLKEQENALVEKIKKNYYAGVGGWWKKGCGWWRSIFNKLPDSSTLESLLQLTEKNTVIGAAFQVVFDSMQLSRITTPTSAINSPVPTVTATVVEVNRDPNNTSTETLSAESLNSQDGHRPSTQLSHVSPVLESHKLEKTKLDDAVKLKYNEIVTFFSSKMDFVNVTKSLEAVDEALRASVAKKLIEEYLFSEFSPYKDQLDSVSLEYCLGFVHTFALTDLATEAQKSIETSKRAKREEILTNVTNGDFSESSIARVGALCTIAEILAAKNKYFASVESIIVAFNAALDGNNLSDAAQQLELLWNKLRLHCQEKYISQAENLLMNWLNNNKKNVDNLKTVLELNAEEKCSLIKFSPDFINNVDATLTAEKARQAEIQRQKDLAAASKPLHDAFVKIVNEFIENKLTVTNFETFLIDAQALTQGCLILSADKQQDLMNRLSKLNVEAKPSDPRHSVIAYFISLTNAAFTTSAELSVPAATELATLQQNQVTCVTQLQVSYDALSAFADKIIQQFKNALQPVFQYPLEIIVDPGTFFPKTQSPQIQKYAENPVGQLSNKENQPKLDCVKELLSTLALPALKEKIMQTGLYVGEAREKIIAEIFQQIEKKLGVAFSGEKFNTCVTQTRGLLVAMKTGYCPETIAAQESASSKNPVVKISFGGGSACGYAAFYQPAQDKKTAPPSLVESTTLRRATS